MISFRKWFNIVKTFQMEIFFLYHYYLESLFWSTQLPWVFWEGLHLCYTFYKPRASDTYSRRCVRKVPEQE